MLAPRPSGGLLPAQVGEPLFETVGIIATRPEEVRQRSLGCPAGFCEIDIEQPAVPLAEATGDHNRIDLPALGRMDNGPGGVVGRKQADVVGADHDQVRLLARRERADPTRSSRPAQRAPSIVAALRSASEYRQALAKAGLPDMIVVLYSVSNP